jgi:uracil phosphoribosyltransferase
MTRTYSHITTPSACHLLGQLADQHTSPNDYQLALTGLGKILGEAILQEIPNRQSSVYLASTVEDADFLAAGILQILAPQLSSIGFACFWNQRSTPFGIQDLTIAPIIRKYQEPATTVNNLIIVKSIISGACVVKTNLNKLIETIEPEKIFVVAPVIHAQAEQNLAKEFSAEISRKFQFFYFAKDDEINAQGEVLPGIGGMIYQRLGFADQEDKNRYTPKIVKMRRARQLQLQ